MGHARAFIVSRTIHRIQFDIKRCCWKFTTFTRKKRCVQNLKNISGRPPTGRSSRFFPYRSCSTFSIGAISFFNQLTASELSRTLSFAWMWAHLRAAEEPVWHPAAAAPSFCSPCIRTCGICYRIACTRLSNSRSYDIRCNWRRGNIISSYYTHYSSYTVLLTNDIEFIDLLWQTVHWIPAVSRSVPTGCSHKITSFAGIFRFAKIWFFLRESREYSIVDGDLFSVDHFIHKTAGDGSIFYSRIDWRESLVGHDPPTFIRWFCTILVRQQAGRVNFPYLSL